MTSTSPDRRAVLLLIAAAVALVGLAGWSTDWSIGVRLDADMEKRLRRATGQRGDDIRVTRVPFQLPGYFYDASAGVGERVNLLDLMPEAAFAGGAIPGGTSLRVKIGEAGIAARVRFAWSTKAEGFSIEVFDALDRPVGRWAGESGSSGPLRLSGGVYRVLIASASPLGAQSTLDADVSADTEERRGRLFGEMPRGADVPEIQLMLSPSNLMKWRRIRMKAERMLDAIGRPRDLPRGRVKGRLGIDGTESQVSLSLAGQGFIGHVSSSTPSFTVRLKAGPLVRGLSRFKLYSVNSVSILDYAVTSLMADEGVLVPRQFLVRLSLNQRDLGLYVIEEVPANKGHFTALRRHDGQVFSEFKAYVDKLGAWLPKRPLTMGEMRSEAVLGALDAPSFARMLALTVRFHATHGLQYLNLRLYRPALLESLEPWLRDINVDHWSHSQLGLRATLTHVGWWLNPTLFTKGAYRNPKVFSPSGNTSDHDDAYFTGPHTTGFSEVVTIVKRFLSQPRHRQAFEQALLYYSAPQLNTRLLTRLAALQRHLAASGQGGRIADGMDFVKNDFTAARVARLLLANPRLIADASGQAGGDGQARLTLFNGGAISLTLDLPDYASSGGASIDGETLLPPSPHYLTLVKESLLLPTAALSGDKAGPADILRHLSSGEWRRFIALERYLGGKTPAASGRAVLDVSLPRERVGDLLAWLGAPGHVRVAGKTPVPPQAIRTLAPAGADEAESVGAPPPTRAPLPTDLLVWLMDTVPARGNNATVLRYLIGNVSRKPVAVDLEGLRIRDAKGRVLPVRSLNASLLKDSAFSPAGSGPIVLAPSRQDSDWYSTRWFPFYWPAGPAPLLAGQEDPAAANILIAEVELRSCHDSFKTDATDLTGQGNMRKRKAIVLEPFLTLCPDRWPVAGAIGAMPKPVLAYSGHEVSQDRPLKRRRRNSILHRMSPGNMIDDDLGTVWQPAKESSEDNWTGFKFSEPLSLEAVELVFAPGAAEAVRKGAALELQASDTPPQQRRWRTLSSTDANGEAFAGNGPMTLTLPVGVPEAFPHYRLLSPVPKALALREVRFLSRTGSRFAPTRTIDDLIAAGLFVVAGEDSSGLRVVIPTGAGLSLDDIIEIPANTLLRLEEGTELRLGKDGGILSYGPIEALGTPGHPVRIQPRDPENGFIAIAVVGARRPSLLSHVEFSGARGGFMGPHQFSGGISVYGSEIAINGGTFRTLNSNDGLHLAWTRFTIAGVEFEDTFSDAIDVDWSFGEIRDSRFKGCGILSGDCIDLSASRVLIADLDIGRASDKGISIGEGSIVDLRNVSVHDSRIGIAVKDGSDAIFNGCRLEKNQYGLISYIKQPYFSSPRVETDGCEIKDNTVNRHSEPNELWTRRFD